MQIAQVAYKMASDFGNGYRNGAILALYLCGGSAVVFGVNSIARKFFDSKKSYISNLADMIAFASVTAASYYLAPHTPLVKFEAQFLSIISLMLPTLLGISNENTLTVSWVACVGLAGMGVGLVGHRSLAPATVFAAGFTIIILKS